MSESKQVAKPNMGFLRLYQIIGDTKRQIDPLIPVSASTWWAGCKRGIYPKPCKLSRNVTVWRRDEVMAFLQSVATREE